MLMKNKNAPILLFPPWLSQRNVRKLGSFSLKISFLLAPTVSHKMMVATMVTVKEPSLLEAYAPVVRFEDIGFLMSKLMGNGSMADKLNLCFHLSNFHATWHAW